MMQDVNDVSCFIDPLVHQYTIATSPLHIGNVTIRPFAYSFDVFSRCNNSRHVTASDTLSISITSSSILSLHTLYHTPLNFSTVCNFGSVPIIYHQDTECHVLLIPVAPPTAITWISFDSVINFLAHVLLRQRTTGNRVLRELTCVIVLTPA